jgi:pyruvate-formate lyase-activating enzyme
MSRKVVFYGAGENAELKHKFSLSRIGEREVVAFCDRDSHKQGKNFLGLPVMSFVDAEKQFGDFDVYVTANAQSAPNIIGFLLENGVALERIINYEPVEKRSGCAAIESRIFLIFSSDHLEFIYCCCASGLGRFMEERPMGILDDNRLDGNIFSGIINDKLKIAEKLKNAPQHTPPLCENCGWYKKSGYHYANSKLRQIDFVGYAPCNFKCYHCANIQQWEKCTYNAWDIILDRFGVIEESGLMADDCLVVLALGEYTVVRNHGAILKRLERYPLILFSNAYVWSDPTAEALSNGNTWLRVSVDAGTRETFKKIKGVDGWERVCGNLEKYSKLGTLVLKYIIFPGQNDDEANLNGFYELCDRLGAKANLVRDFAEKEGDGDFTDETLERAAEFIIHFQSRGKLYGVECRPGERARLQALLKAKGALPVSQWENS